VFNSNLNSLVAHSGYIHHETFSFMMALPPRTLPEGYVWARV